MSLDSETQVVVDDARRFIEVWQDPETNPIALIKDLINCIDTACDAACAELREELEGEHKDELEDINEELRGVLELIDRDAERKYSDHTPIMDLVRALEREVSTVKLRIAADCEREMANKIADLEHTNERQLFQIKMLEAKVARLQTSSPKAKRPRARRGVSPDGAKP